MSFYLVLLQKQLSLLLNFKYLYKTESLLFYLINEADYLRFYIIIICKIINNFYILNYFIINFSTYKYNQHNLQEFINFYAQKYSLFFTLKTISIEYKKHVHEVVLNPSEPMQIQFLYKYSQYKFLADVARVLFYKFIKISNPKANLNSVQKTRFYINRLPWHKLSVIEKFYLTNSYQVGSIFLLLKHGYCLLNNNAPDVTDTECVADSLKFFNAYLMQSKKKNEFLYGNIHFMKNNSIFNSLTGNYFLLFFLDIEYLTGLSICVQLNYIRHIIFPTRIRIFRAFFTGVRRNWWCNWQINIFSAFDAVALSLITKDVDSLLLFFCSIFQGIHFSNVSRVLVAYINIIQALWIYARDCLLFSGIKVLFRGKLGWRLLTRKKTFKLILGSVGSNSQFYNCIYRYNTVATDTGVFGLSIFFFYKPKHVSIDKEALRKLIKKY